MLLCFNPDVTKQEQSLPPHWGATSKHHLAFEAPKAQYETWKAHLAAAGVPITCEYNWGRGHESFYFEDPDGHVLEVVQPGLWE